MKIYLYDNYQQMYMITMIYICRAIDPSLVLNFCCTLHIKRYNSPPFIKPLFSSETIVL